MGWLDDVARRRIEEKRRQEDARARHLRDGSREANKVRKLVVAALKEIARAYWGSVGQKWKLSVVNAGLPDISWEARDDDGDLSWHYWRVRLDGSSAGGWRQGDRPRRHAGAGQRADRQDGLPQGVDLDVETPAPDPRAAATAHLESAETCTGQMRVHLGSAETCRGRMHAHLGSAETCRGRMDACASGVRRNLQGSDARSSGVCRNLHGRMRMRIRREHTRSPRVAHPPSTHAAQTCAGSPRSRDNRRASVRAWSLRIPRLSAPP